MNILITKWLITFLPNIFACLKSISMADQCTPSPSQLWAIFRLCASTAETSSGNFDNPWYIWSILLQVKFSFCFFLRKMRTQTMLTINLTWIKGACYNMTQKRRIDASTKATNEKLYPIQYLDAPTVLSFLQNHVSFLSDYTRANLCL